MFQLRLLPWEYGVRNLFRRPARSGLTLAALTTVVLLVLVVVAFIRGLEDSLAVSGDPQVVLAAEPAAAQGVKEVRANAKDAEEVTLVGRIGGEINPWIEGQAAFLIVDSALKPCNEQHDDACKTPWDYCCDADTLPASKALVKVVDSSGSTVATDARKLLGVKELQTVVVHGRAKRDEAGNLTVLADGIFVRK